MGVFPAYIDLFAPEKILIAACFLSELIPFSGFYGFSPFCPEAKEGFHSFNKRPAPHSDTIRPLILTPFVPIPHIFFDPPSVTVP